MAKPIISVVIPCYNEQDNIAEMHKRLTNVLRSLTQHYEIIFIDNGSTDNSETMFRKTVHKDTHVIVLSYSRNFGPHGAYTGGLEYASGKAVVCIDGDLQDPPELIAEFVKKWKQGYEVIYGIRKRRKGRTLINLFTFLHYRILNKLSYVYIPLDAGDFALMDRKVVDHIVRMPEHDKYFSALRAWVGYRQTGIPYSRAERHAGETKFNFLGYLQWSLHGIFSFSYKPLELISYLAIFVVFMTILGIGVYFALFFLYPANPRGFITLILVMLFLGGVQLLCLSIIGQYLAKIFEEVKNRPRYIIKEIIKKK